MEDAFVDLFEFLIEAVRHASVLQVNGERWSLSAEERGRLVHVAKDTFGRVPIMMGISAPTIDASLSYIRAAEETRRCVAICRKPTS